MDKYIVAPPAGSTQNSVGAEDGKWQKGYFEKLPNWQEYLAESTGYGIVSGCEPTISGLTVTVASGIVHLADGTRKEIASTNITLDAADSTNLRIDLVYIDNTGAVAKITGTASATPAVPSVPANGISVATVTVAANATTGTVKSSKNLAVITDKNVLKAAQINSVVFLSHYNNIEEAIDNIDNNTLVIDTSISSDTEILIDGHSDFTIIGTKNSFIDASIKINDCSNFAVKGLRTGGTSTKRTFYVMYCHDFSLSECFIDGTSNRKHEGLHIYECYNLVIKDNHVKYSELDAILIHANCYGFVVSNNIVEQSGAVGIEVEGRTDGSLTNPVYARCHDGVVSNNYIDSAWQSVLCLFSDNIIIDGNRCFSAIDITGSKNVTVGNNVVKSNSYALNIGVQLFSFNADNKCKNITVSNNVFLARRGLDGYPLYGYNGLITIRGTENTIFANNDVIFDWVDGVYTGVAYIVVFDAQFLSITHNNLNPADTDHPLAYGIKLLDRNTEYSTNTLVKYGLYEVNITDNMIRNFTWGIGTDVETVNGGDNASNLYDITISGNTLYGGPGNQVGLTIMYLDTTCTFKLGKNVIRDCAESLNVYGSTARIISYDYQDANNYGANSIITISNSAKYWQGDTIYNPSTTEAFKVCVASGTPGTWKSVALS